MKQPIALLLTDTHLKEDNIEINKSIYKQAISLAKELGLQEIDHLGDVFDSRKAQTQNNLNAFDDIACMFEDAGIKLNVVVGNHDKTNYKSEVSFVKQFRHHPNINIFNEFGTIRRNNFIFHYLSFFDDEIYINKLSELLKEADIKNSILLTHIGISGSVMNNGRVIASENITPSLFKNFDLTLVGHFHDAQYLAEGKIKYIGASLQHNYGEKSGKGATILYNDLSSEIKPLNAPQYIKYEVSVADLTAKDIEELKKEKETSGDNIRLILTGKDSEIKSFNKQLLIDAGLSVAKKEDKVEKEELESRVNGFDVHSLHEEFKIFCDKNKLDYDKGFKYLSKII